MTLVIFNWFDSLESLALLLIVTHFTPPLVYYLYARANWLPKPWNLRIDESYKPYVTIILPTYNEAEIIKNRLDNMYEQDYPRDLIEVIVIDSGSSDGTPDLIEEWAREHSDLALKLIREPVRMGKVHALNHALRYARGEVIVIADADALWPANALSKTVKWISDPLVGAVSSLKKPLGPGNPRVEESYRKHYNVLRIAESKAFSTPIFHGELAAFRADLLREVDGFSRNVGADDSHTATKIASKGFRSIIPEDLWIVEMIPRNGYFSWRVRRAQHLLQHFVESLKLEVASSEFRRILLVESYLHLINPWLLVMATVIFLVSAIVNYSILATVMLALGLALLTFKSYRSWVMAQLFLILGMIKNCRNKEIVWTKQNKR
ncbi:MAG: glycosyltransferase [Candidatus Korarchaeum sp.]